MPAKPIGVGIIGTGFGAAVQLPGFLRIPGCRVIGIVGNDPGRSIELQKKYGLQRAFRNPLELISCPEVHLVSVATPPTAHVALVKAAIDAGKAVLCEKPFTMSVADATDLLKKANTRGIIHGVDLEFRELPAIRFLKEQLDRHSVGQVQSMELSWCVGTWADPDRPWRWQCDRALGGGVITALGIHLFDLAEWLLGPMATIKASTGTTIHERKDQAGIVRHVTSEDHAEISVETAGGINVHIRLSNVDRAGRGFSIDVRGTSQALSLRSTTQNYGGGGMRVEIKRPDDAAQTLFEDRDSHSGDARIPPFVALAERFVAAVRAKDMTFHPSFAHGVRAQQFLEGVRQSAETRKTVSIR